MTEASRARARERSGQMLRILILTLAVILMAAGGLMLLAGPMLFRMGLLDLPTARGSFMQAARNTGELRHLVSVK